MFIFPNDILMIPHLPLKNSHKPKWSCGAWPSLTAFPGFWYGGKMERKKGRWKKGGCGGGAFLLFSDANERTNGFPAFSLQSVSPLQHALLPGHCGRTKLQALDPITWNFSREAAIVYREAAREGLGERGETERRKGRVTWQATRVQATSFLFPPSLLALLLFLLIRSFSSPLSSIPPPPYLCTPLHHSPLG